jgi:hypothetical protein
MFSALSLIRNPIRRRFDHSSGFFQAICLVPIFGAIVSAFGKPVAISQTAAY